MSALQYPDAFDGQELQIWNNAAFDNGESEDSTAIQGTWENLKSVYMNRSLESDCSKENLSPCLNKSPVSSFKSCVPTHPLQEVNKNAIKNSEMKPLKSALKEEETRDEKQIDIEIEEIEKEISRLSSRLEVLRLEKLDMKSKAIEKRGRFVPAKFMEQKHNFNMKTSEETLLSSAKSKMNRRGMSLGPAEIFSAVKSRPSFGKPEIITPVQSIQNRRKSCFWKLQEIDELKVTKERGKSQSLSPKSRKTGPSKIQAPKQAVTTVGSKKIVKKEENNVLSLIQPRKLFKEGEKSVTKKPLKPGRMVASRYNQITNDAARKRSWPDNEKEDSIRCDKRRTSRENLATPGRNQKTETAIRAKKKWEIPTAVVVYNGSPRSVSKMGDVLPKIRTVQCVDQSPRDSGAAKRVAELVGRKPFFCIEEDEEDGDADEGFVRQALRFDDEDYEE